jgi:peptidyl-prolyl cis-trans isomerase A (cyclophilin A)
MRQVVSPSALLLAAALGLAACATGDPCAGPTPPPSLPPGHVLLDPDIAAVRVVPPDSFDVRFETTQGVVTARFYRDWAPLGVYRFYNLARHGYYDGARFFRVLPGFIAQFGLSGRPEADQLWNELPLPDDPRRWSNRAGTIAFAKAGPDTRTTQLFFNYADNRALDEQDFAPVGRVIDGMGVLFMLHSGYGETPASGCILSHGNQYLARRYPRLDYIERAVVVE